MKIKLTAEQQAIKENGFCIHTGCENPHGPGRNTCHKHTMANYRKNNPMQYRYNIYKQNQKKANRVAITFTEFSKQK